jgi:hypothetical protein
LLRHAAAYSSTQVPAAFCRSRYSCCAALCYAVYLHVVAVLFPRHAAAYSSTQVPAALCRSRYPCCVALCCAVYLHVVPDFISLACSSIQHSSRASSPVQAGLLCCSARCQIAYKARCCRCSGAEQYTLPHMCKQHSRSIQQHTCASSPVQVGLLCCSVLHCRNAGKACCHCSGVQLRTTTDTTHQRCLLE